MTAQTGEIPPIVAIRTMRTRFPIFSIVFPAVNSLRMNKKLKYSNSYMIPTKPTYLGTVSTTTTRTTVTTSVFIAANKI